MPTTTNPLHRRGFASASEIAARRVKANALTAAWLFVGEATFDEPDPQYALHLATQATQADWARVTALAGVRIPSAATQAVVLNDLARLADPGPSDPFAGF